MPAEPDTLFVIGCPRSGTTWVQLLLAQEPRIATAPETQIFSFYLSHFRRQWQQEHQDADRDDGQGSAGLSRLLSEPEFEELCRRNAQYVLERIAARNPGASLVVEKSPRHALIADFIERILPDARFLHVIRDPRDCVASMVSAGRSWGANWAPRDAVSAARLWVLSIERARRVGGDPLRFREVRYEQLRPQPVSELGAILHWLGVDVAADFCERAVAACDLRNLQDGKAQGLPVPGSKSPPGFFGQGSVGGWQKQLRRSELEAVEYICGALMDELGYDRVLARRSRPPLRLAVRDRVDRLREGVNWQLERLAARL